MSKFQIRALIIAIAIFITVKAVRVHSDRSTDDYFPKLNEIQSQFTEDLQTLKQQMNNLNKNLDNALTDQKRKAILSQGLADQRDTIFRIDSYLSIPYEDRECQCHSITSKQKEQLVTQANAVKKSIDAMQQTLKQCKGCNLISELQKQLSLQKNYLRIINDTVNGACCNEQYSICEKGFVFNQLTRKCQVQVDSSHTGNGTFVVVDTNGTNIIDQLTPQCPVTAPLWNAKTQLCQICTIQTPYWNKTTKHCQKCQDNTLYSQELRTCWKACPESTNIYNYERRKCQIFLSGASICPNDAPIWDPQLLYCRKCPKNTPLWNIATQKCQKCPQNTSWRQDLSFCVQNCNKGFILNEQNGQCEGECLDITKPAWDGYTRECVSCPGAAPVWDSKNRKCGSCPPEKAIWNVQRQQCQQKPINSEANGTAFIRDSNTSSCFNGMFFDQDQLRCRCPDNKVYKQELKACSSCADGSHFDIFSQICVQNLINGKQSNGTVITEQNGSKIQCKEGQHYSAGFSKCIPICKADQLYDVHTGDCRKICKEKFVYNIATKSCEAKSFYCPKGAYYDQNIHKCLTCPVGFIYVPDSRKCRFLCQQGQTYSAETRKCQ